MAFYRCLICGETYMGDAKPSNCPFCGARGHYLVSASEWVDENSGIGGLSDVSRRNLEKALQLEVNNSPFYRDAMLRSNDIELQGIFKYLSKVEAEHAAVIRKMLKCELPPMECGKDTALDDDKGNLMAAHEREKSASAFYRQAEGEAAEPRVKRVFKALSEIEEDHVCFEGKLLEGR